MTTNGRGRSSAGGPPALAGDGVVHKSVAAAAFFDGPGEVRALARTLDWGATPLGWPDTWPSALRIATAVMLDAPHPVCLWSGPEFALVYNDAYRRILAAKHPAALGRPGSVVWAEIWEGLAPQFAQVWSGGPPVYGEDARFVMARLEGGGTEDAWFSYSLSSLREEDGTIVAVLNISPETTARVRAEAALRESEAKFRGLFESMIEAYCVIEMIFDDAGRPVDFLYVETNPAFVAQATMPMLGQRIRELVPDFEQFWIDQYGQVALTGQPVRLEHVVTGLGDQWFHTSAFRIGGEGSRRVGVVFENITERKRAETARERLLEDARVARAEAERAREEADVARRAAEEARSAAEAANQAKAAFLSAMSHELRTPLNAVAGYAELLVLGLRGPLTDAQRQDLERLRRANQHMAGLVESVLSFARVEAGGVEYHLEEVRLGPLVADLEALVGPQFAAKRLAYDHDACGPETPERPHVVRADPEKVRQILLNLLTNAAKFTDAGGRVSLACETDVPAGVVRMRVTDTGRGIPADQLARIFEPFVQVDRQRTPDGQQGVGLGLAISRDLARGMGGDLTAESTPGEGSTFTLALPAA